MAAAAYAFGACSTFGADGDGRPAVDASADGTDGGGTDAARAVETGALALSPLPPNGLPPRDCDAGVCDSFDDGLPIFPRLPWTSMRVENGGRLTISTGEPAPNQGLLEAFVEKQADKASQVATLVIDAPLRADWLSATPARFQIVLRFLMKVEPPFTRVAGPRISFRGSGGDTSTLGIFVNVSGGVSLEQLDPSCKAPCYLASDTVKAPPGGWNAWHDVAIVAEQKPGALATVHVVVDGNEDGTGREIRFPIAARAADVRFGISHATDATATIQLDDFALTTASY